MLLMPFNPFPDSPQSPGSSHFIFHTPQSPQALQALQALQAPRLSTQGFLPGCPRHDPFNVPSFHWAPLPLSVGFTHILGSKKAKLIYFRTDMNVLGHLILHITTIWAECSSFLSAGPRLVHKSSQSESCSPEMAPHVPCQGQHSVKEKGSWASAKGWLLFCSYFWEGSRWNCFYFDDNSLIIQSLPISKMRYT